jgi:hypothetical protein
VAVGSGAWNTTEWGDSLYYTVRQTATKTEWKTTERDQIITYFHTKVLNNDSDDLLRVLSD